MLVTVEAVACALIVSFGMASITGLFWLDGVSEMSFSRFGKDFFGLRLLPPLMHVVSVIIYLTTVAPLSREIDGKRPHAKSAVNTEVTVGLGLIVAMMLAISPGILATTIALLFHCLLYWLAADVVSPHGFPGEATVSQDGSSDQGQLRMSMSTYIQRCHELEEELSSVNESTAVLATTLASITEGIIVVDNRGKLLYTNHAANEILGFPDWQAPMQEWTQAYSLEYDHGVEIRTNYEWPLTRAASGEIVEMERVVVVNQVTSREIPLTINAGPLCTSDGRQIGGVAVMRDNSRLTRAEQEQKRAHRLYHYHKWALDQFAIVVELDMDGTIIYANDRFCQLSQFRREELIGESYTLANSSHHPQSFYDRLWEVLHSGKVWQGEMKCRAKQGDEYWVDATFVPYFDQDGKPEKFLSIRTLIDERKKAEEARERLSLELAESSRQAGMAEVATGVLHNVGNVLNSVNVSANILADKIRTLRIDSLVKAADIISQQENVCEFFTTDPRAKAFPQFLSASCRSLLRDRHEMLDELSGLCGNIAHVKEIVGMQQSLAKAGGIIQKTSLLEIIADAIKIVDSLSSSLVTAVTSRFEFDVVMPVDKHKVLQILINLITNAKHAVQDLPCEERQVEVVMSQPTAAILRIEVTDNGVGIRPDLIDQLFQHGFTTKKHGHGFGLHSSAIAAKQMSGSLLVTSDGEGFGARFVLDLPLSSAEVIPNEETALVRR